MRAHRRKQEIDPFMPEPMRHAILGAGGIGGLIGASLARNGAAVTMVVRRASLATYPEQLQLESPFGNFSVPVAHTSEVPPADVLWLTVKATQLPAAIEAIKQPGVDQGHRAAAQRH